MENKIPKNYIKTIIEQDCKNIIKNPYMGWIVYVEYSCLLHNALGYDKGCIDANYPELFFERLDKEIEKGLRPNILYLRLGWQTFEPEKNNYSWRNENSIISKYIEGAKKRKMQIAFRILVSDENTILDKEYNNIRLTVPKWLYEEKGFEYYFNNEQSRTPYYDNEVYLYYYEKLIKELSKDFNNPDLVAFIDAQGLGTWGEMHDLQVSGRLTLQQTLETHAKIWTTYFNKVLLGATFGGGAEDINENVIVPKYNYMIRRDAFGSKWMGDFNSRYLKNFFPKKIPMYAEVCYWHLKDESYIKEHFPEDNGIKVPDIRTYLEYAIKQAQECRANTLDLRVPADWSEWSEKGLDLANKFAIENGYRLSVTEIMYPKEFIKNKEIEIFYKWKNSGLGFLPIHNNQLKGNFKVSVALLNNTNEVIYQHIDNFIEPSWLKEDSEVLEVSKLIIPQSLDTNEYKFAIGIVNKNNIPAINLAILNLETIKQQNTWYGSWYVIDNIKVV